MLVRGGGSIQDPHPTVTLTSAAIDKLTAAGQDPTNVVSGGARGHEQSEKILMPRQTLQHFELHVLLAMLREGGETYSVPLVVALEKRMGRPVAQAAVFIALSRLEKKGLVTSRLDERDGGRARRYFKLTRPGLAAVKEIRIEHARLWRGLGRLLSTHKV